MNQDEDQILNKTAEGAICLLVRYWINSLLNWSVQTPSSVEIRPVPEKPGGPGGPRGPGGPGGPAPKEYPIP